MHQYSPSGASLVAQLVKNLPAVQETGVRFLGWEYLLEKEIATPSSILAWKISWTEEPGGLQSMGSQRVGHDWATNTYTYFYSPSPFKIELLSFSQPPVHSAQNWFPRIPCSLTHSPVFYLTKVWEVLTGFFLFPQVERQQHGDQGFGMSEMHISSHLLTMGVDMWEGMRLVFYFSL